MAIVKKITTGFVVQEYDTDTGKFVSQDFVAGDQVDWEDEDGNAIPEEDAYLSFEMVQPEDMEDGEVEKCPECGTPLIKDGKECPNCGKFF